MVIKMPDFDIPDLDATVSDSGCIPFFSENLDWVQCDDFQPKMAVALYIQIICLKKAKNSWVLVVTERGLVSLS